MAYSKSDMMREARILQTCNQRIGRVLGTVTDKSVRYDIEDVLIAAGIYDEVIDRLRLKAALERKRVKFKHEMPTWQLVEIGTDIGLNFDALTC